MSGSYLIFSRASGPGELALWWGPNRCGYTVDVDEAGRYTAAEAADAELCRPGLDIKVPVDAVKNMVVRVVPTTALEKFL